ncbi:copper resistance protein CopC, partial [Kibdelosporangium lantanae]
MITRTVGILLAAISTLLVTAFPALAHNEFKSSNPAGGATLDTAPTSVTLTFSEELIDGQATFTITGPDGASAS